MKNPNRGPLLGLLAMFRAAANAALPKFAVGVGNRQNRPAAVSAWLQARAKAKRERRAARKA